MKTPKLKYSIRRGIAAVLCVGMLFSDIGSEVSLRAEGISVVETQNLIKEDEEFYLHGSGGNITEGELPFELREPTKQNRTMARVMSVLNYTTSQAGIDEIIHNEGIVLDADGMARAYDDMQSSVILEETTPIKGTITIGYGHTGKVNGEDIAWDTRLTLKEAEDLLRIDIAKFENAVNNFCNTYGIALTQYQFDALVCFTFNIGTEWTTNEKSSMSVMLRSGYEKYSEDEIVEIFSLYKYSSKILIPGLVKRRRREAAMFLNNPALKDYKTGNYKVDTDSLKIRAGAGTTYQQVGTLSRGSVITVKNVSKEWWGETDLGWVHLGYCCYVINQETSPTPEPETPVKPEQPTEPETPVEPETPIEPETPTKPETPEEPEQPTKPETPAEENYPTGFYLVTAESLNIRSGPDINETRIGIAKGGTVVYVSQTSGKWGKISKGWISLNPSYSQVYKPQKPVVSTKSNTSQGVKLGWSKIADVSGYYVYRKTGTGSYEKIKTISSAGTTTYTDTDVSNGKQYKYKVYAYRKIDGAVCKSAASSQKTIVRLKGTSISSAKSSSAKKFTVCWNKDSKVNGYELQYSTSSSFAASKTKSITVKSNATGKHTISGLTSKKKYYVRVRTYKTTNGVTYRSAWSTKTLVVIK